MKSPKKDALIIPGSTLGPKLQANLLEKTLLNSKKLGGIVEKLDMHYCVLCWKIAPPAELLYFLRTNTCFNHPALLKKYGKTVRDGLPEVCNVNFDDISSTQFDLPAKMGVCVFSPTMMINMALDWWRRSMTSDLKKYLF